MITIEISNADQITLVLDNIAKHAQNRQPLMRRLAGTMHSAVDQNFEAGGRPAWLGVKHRQGTPLNDTGNLKNSLHAFSDNETAQVGTNLIYAPLHQFGGTIRPKKGKYLKFNVGERFVSVESVTVPARPFLSLTLQDEDDLLDDAQAYFRSLIKS